MSALLIQVPAFHGRSSLRYMAPFWTVFLCLFCASLIPTGSIPREALILLSVPFRSEIFGLTPTHLVLLSFLAFACGAQNNLFLVERNLVFRTTHLTGTTADLATHLVRIIFKLHANDEQATLERRLAWLRAFSITCFFCGAAVGFTTYQIFERGALYIPAATAFFLAVYVTFYFYARPNSQQRKARHKKLA